MTPPLSLLGAAALTSEELAELQLPLPLLASIEKQKAKALEASKWDTGKGGFTIDLLKKKWTPVERVIPKLIGEWKCPECACWTTLDRAKTHTRMHTRTRENQEREAILSVTSQCSFGCLGVGRYPASGERRSCMPSGRDCPAHIERQRQALRDRWAKKSR